jgi:hypothetical protein
MNESMPKQFVLQLAVVMTVITKLMGERAQAKWPPSSHNGACTTR